MIYHTGNRAAAPGSFPKTCGGLTVLEQEAMRVFELRRVLRVDMWGELLVKPEDFAQVIELHTPQEID
jgi:hypothetical protein